MTIIYASTSGHTEYVVSQVAEELRSAKKDVRVLRVELAKPEDLSGGGLLILASSSWNTGGIEGQLNPHMYEFLLGRAKDAKLAGAVALIALGDERYRYLAQAGKHLRTFVETHGGKVLEPQLTILNEPYGQEEKAKAWAREILPHLA